MIGGGVLWVMLIGGADTSPGEDTTAAVSGVLALFKLLSFFLFTIAPAWAYLLNFRVKRFIVHTRVDGIIRVGNYIKKKLK